MTVKMVIYIIYIWCR